MRERNNILAEPLLSSLESEEQRIQYEFVNGCDTRRVSFAIDLIKPMHRIKKHSL